MIKLILFPALQCREIRETGNWATRGDIASAIAHAPTTGIINIDQINHRLTNIEGVTRCKNSCQ